MKIFLHALLTLLLFLGAQVPLQAQGGDSGDFCSLFYLKSNKPDILPFDNDCFTHVTYHVLDHRRLEYVGPIVDHHDLFKPSPWGITLDLPPINGNVELKIVSPESPADGDAIAPDGFAHLFVSKYDHEGTANSYEGRPDYRAISGFMRIQDYNASPEAGKFQCVAFVNCYVREVVDGKMVGSRINLRFSIIVREDYPVEKLLPDENNPEE